MRFERPEFDATVDGAGMVQMNAPKTAKTCGEYNKTKIGDKACFLLACVEQLDIVFDAYQKGSCKRETREGHGKKDSVRLSIKENTTIYRKFAKVLKLDDNQTELFNLITDTLSGLFRRQHKVLLITRQQTVLSNREVDLQRLQPCNKEEADDRILLHAMDQSRLRFKRLMIVTADTDVLVIALYAC